MLVNTKGFVVRTVNYGESSAIATIYTSVLGLRSYMLKGVRSGSKNRKGNIYQPMQFLDLVVNERENKNLQYVREAKIDFLYREVPYNIKKTAIGLFILELISITVKEMEANEALYDFMQEKFKQLDQSEGNYSAFHLEFMLDFSRLLGFYPYDNYNEQNFLFALQDGLFVSLDDNYPNCLAQDESLLFHQFLADQQQAFSKSERKQLLKMLERYYQFHVAEFRSFKTPTVFEGVFG